MQEQEKMNEKKESKKEFDTESLQALRDQIKVKAHLLNTEMKQLWNSVEKDWNLLQSEAKRLAPEAKDALKQSAKAAQPLVNRIGESLVRIREGLDRHHR